jgi:hypothetical protein
MAKTGKRSAADLAVVRPEGGFTRLRPPADLGEAERTIWTSIVTACAARHFEASDAPLLRRYVQNVVLAQQAAALEREGAVIAARRSPWLTVAATADKATGGAVHAAADLATGAAAARDDGADVPSCDGHVT